MLVICVFLYTLFMNVVVLVHLKVAVGNFGNILVTWGSRETKKGYFVRVVDQAVDLKVARVCQCSIGWEWI